MGNNGHGKYGKMLFCAGRGAGDIPLIYHRGVLQGKMEKKKTERAYRLDKVDRSVSYIFTAFTFISIAAVVFIMLNTTINVITRSFFSHAINGSVQLSQIVLSLVALCSLPIVTMFNTHIKVDVVAEKLPEKGQKFLVFMNLFLSGLTMFVCGYYTILKAIKTKAMGLAMDVPAFPHWPIYMLIAIMFIISGLCAFYNFYHYAYTGTVVTMKTFDEVKERLSGKKEKEGEN